MLCVFGSDGILLFVFKAVVTFFLCPPRVCV